MGEQVVAGSNGGVAQLGEHLPCKQGVKSSNLSVSIAGKPAGRTLKTEYRKQQRTKRHHQKRDTMVPGT